MSAISSNPLFSVIIPTYNHAHLISTCLRSLLTQTFSSWEAIVVNNFSEDDTVSVVSRFSDPRIRLFNFRNNGIIAASRNEGLRHAQGKYIAFLDSDDWWYSDKLDMVSAAMDNADLVHHDLDIVTSRGKRFLKLRGRQLKKPVFVDLLTHGNPIYNSSACVRKSVLDKTGGLSEEPSLVSMEDFDLWLRIAAITDRFVHIPRILGAYQEWDGNISKSADRFISTYQAIFKKFKGSLSPWDLFAAERFEAYCIGIKKAQQGNYEEARQLFFRSLRSPNPDTMMLRSLLRIVSSFAQQTTSLVRKSYS